MFKNKSVKNESKLLSLTQLVIKLGFYKQVKVLFCRRLRGCITNGHPCEYLILVHITLQELCVHFSHFKWYK